MPLSRNLYEINDLAAALLFSLEESNISLASSIINELLLSLETDLVHKLLGFAWLLAQPDKDLTPQRFTAWRSRRYDSLLASFKDVPLRLSPSTPVCNNYPLPPIEDYEPPTEWRAQPYCWTDNECGTIYHHVQQAIHNKQAWRAYLIARPLLKYPDALMSFLGALGTPLDILKFNDYYWFEKQILEHAMCILVYPPAPMEIILKEPVQQGRIFHIQPEARNRWHVPPTPPTKLLGQPNFIFEDSPYWNEQRNRYHIDLDTTGHIHYESEQLYQDFFQYNFPLDIPDEWLEAEREKSHPLVPNYEPNDNPWTTTFKDLIKPTPVTVSR